MSAAEDPRALLASFSEAVAASDLEAALGLADRLVDLVPGHPGLRFNRALVLRRMGRDAEAREGFVATLAIDPSHAKARFEAAAIDLEAGRFGEAAEGFAAVLAADPTDDDARLNLGNALVRLGRAAEALEPLRDLARRRQDPAALLALARAEMDAGDLDAADACLARLPPGDPSIAAAALKLRTQGRRGRIRLAVAQAGPTR